MAAYVANHTMTTLCVCGAPQYMLLLNFEYFVFWLFRLFSYYNDVTVHLYQKKIYLIQIEYYYDYRDAKIQIMS